MTIPFLASVYLWTKSFHVISMVAWMVSLLYLPRRFVYHAQVPRGSRDSERFKVMEGRLYKQILVPAMLSTWFFGACLVLTPGIVDWRTDGWWHVKLLCVILMSGFAGAMGGWRRRFLEDRNIKPAKFYRIANEVPTVLLFVIVIMVIVKPF